VYVCIHNFFTIILLSRNAQNNTSINRLHISYNSDWILFDGLKLSHHSQTQVPKKSEKLKNLVKKFNGEKCSKCHKTDFRKF